MAVARDPPQDQEHDRDANFWRLGPITQALDAQRGSTLRQVGRFPPPVSGCLFLISVFDTRRPVRELAETCFVDGAPAASRKLAASRPRWFAFETGCVAWRDGALWAQQGLQLLEELDRGVGADAHRLRPPPFRPFSFPAQRRE